MPTGSKTFLEPQEKPLDGMCLPVRWFFKLQLEGNSVSSVERITETRRRPHIIRVDLGKVRKGQIPIRRGSSTDGITMADLFEL